MTAVAYVYACDNCGFEFQDTANGPKRRTYCIECAYLRRLDRNRDGRRERRASKRQTVVLSDGHPVQPLLAAWVNHDCAMRLALAALRTGRYAEAEDAILECLPDAVPRSA